MKSRPGPGCLNSHCAVKFLSVMIIFGGERNGQTLNEMWRFHFGEYGAYNQFCKYVQSDPRKRNQLYTVKPIFKRKTYFFEQKYSRIFTPTVSVTCPHLSDSHCTVFSFLFFFSATEFWEKLTFVNSQPMPRAQTTAFIFSQFTTRGTVHYMGLPEQVG